MDFKNRDILKDDKGYYRMVSGKKLYTNKNGDVFIEISRSAWDAPLPDSMVSVIESFYPSLGKITSLNDVFYYGVARYDSEMVCFLTGIMNVVFAEDENGCILDDNGRKTLSYYGRPKHPSNGEFESFIFALANDDFSNVSVDNPYEPKEPI